LIGGAWACLKRKIVIEQDRKILLSFRFCLQLVISILSFIKFYAKHGELFTTNDDGYPRAMRNGNPRKPLPARLETMIVG